MNTIQTSKIPVLQEKPGSFSSNSLPKSINYHLTNTCNYRCSFCFAKYGAFTKSLPITKAKKLIRSLVSNGCEKLNFAGGEPTLVPHLADLINYAKSQNLFVSLKSNGTGITFQVHQGQKVNDDFFTQNQGITEEQFLNFIDRHRDLHPVYETSKIMANSYTMITPDGRFYYSHQNTYAYSDPILDVGIEPALSQITFDEANYLQRGGDYYSKESPLSGPMPKSKIKNKK